MTTDVLEHVPPSLVGAVVREFTRVATRRLFCAVATKPESGRVAAPLLRLHNVSALHETLHNGAWWKSQFVAAGEWAAGEQVRRQDSSANDEPMCRICFETGSDGEYGPLFRPCSCRGTSAWVHMECLDHWRKSSVNPRSFYRCDQCHFEYRFGRVFPAGTDKFMLARVLSSRLAVHLLSLFVLLSIVFCGGFVAKSFNGELTWCDVLRCFNIEHMISGSVVTGMGSLLGWVVSLLGGGGGRWLGDAIGYGGRGLGGGGGGGGGNDKAGKIVVIIVVVIGLCIAFKWIYDRIEDYARRTTRMATHVVLDAHHGRAPPAVPAAAPAAAEAAPRRRVSPARPRPRAPIAVD